LAFLRAVHFDIRMKKPPSWFPSVLGFVAAPFLLLGYSAFRRRFPSVEYAAGLCLLFGILLSLPFVFVRMKKDAAPAKGSDFIGYAVILAVLVGVASIAYAVVK
jgi:hypothetical protein